MHVPRPGGHPRPAGTRPVGFLVDQTGIVHVEQLGHLEFFFPVL
jgi:hypothetical protein